MKHGMKHDMHTPGSKGRNIAMGRDALQKHMKEGKIAKKGVRKGGKRR